MKAILAALAASSLFTSAALAAEPVTVKIDAGALVGSSENNINTFKGVPFAKPPVGALRWRAPQKPAAWTGDRQATTYALPCPQPINANGSPNGGGVSGGTSEDCLYLNVTAPKNAKNAPVMLWLYGGAGYLGGGHLGAYNGDAFAKDGVITVTINYRLGMLGNFAHPAVTKAGNAKEGYANYALMDAIAALQWVQTNIGQFGGDKTNVTLFGQSAGGGMVSSLLSSPAAKGLFHKAIVESGAGIDGGVSLADGEKQGATTASAFGLPGADATIEQLRALDPAKIVGNAAGRGGRGVLDGTIKTVNTRTALTSHTEIDVPLIVGSNNGEGGAGGAKTLVDLAAGGKAGAWQYYFTYVPAWKPEQKNGAVHSDEIPYAFGSMAYSSRGGPRTNDQDRAVQAQFHSCWTAFAKMAPTAKTIACANDFNWPSRTPENDAIAVFGNKATIEKATPIVTAQAAATAAAAAARPARPAAAPGAPRPEMKGTGY